MNKLMLILLIFMLSACGGGGSSSSGEQPNPIEPPAPDLALPVYTKYTLTPANGGGQYSGVGITTGEEVYFIPVTVADSQYVTTAHFKVISATSEELTLDIKLYSFKTRQLVLYGEVVLYKSGNELINTVIINGDEYDLTVSADMERGDISTLSDIEGDWMNTSYAGQFGDIVLSLNNSGGQISGYDSSGCNVFGSITENANNGKLFDISLTLSDCVTAGEYLGTMWKDGINLSGSVANSNHSIDMRFKL